MSKKHGKKRAAGDLRESHAALMIGYGFDEAGGAFVILKFGGAEAWVEAANRQAGLATVSLRDVVRLNGDGE